MGDRQLFLKYLAQTSNAPLALEIVKAEGSFLWDAKGNSYLDIIGGISVANTGHRHPRVVKAIQKQLDAYLQVMVYGEYIQSPQVKYAEAICNTLPKQLQSVYFTNSGSEAIEGAMKLAKRVTNRSTILAFNKAYHGSTQGALSIIGDEYWRTAFRPLLPDVWHLEYNSPKSIEAITEQTACVVIEMIQAEAGIIVPNKKWIKEVRKKCIETNTLLVVDEVQSGFGRTGKLWAFEHFGIVPDVLVLGKALGGGLPLGAFISSKSNMDCFTNNPVLGHITTFGGHPLSCAAGKAALEVVLQKNVLQNVLLKEQLFIKLLRQASSCQVRSFGLWIAVELENNVKVQKVINYCLQKGVIMDWFLFSSTSLRISPPLTISNKDIIRAAKIIIEAINHFNS